MKTVGLFEEDTQLYYVDYNFVVVDNPYDGRKPVIIMRHIGDPNMKHVYTILKRVGMELVGQAVRREDGLWLQEVKEVSDESRS